MTSRITTVVGARPQFIKCSLLDRELRRRGFAQRLVHTGQHYDPKLSDVFFRELDVAQPDVNLSIGSDAPGRQVARMLLALDEEFERHRPDLVITFGDTNSTLAVALAARQRGVALAHVEAGMRSYNRAMPEEHNRVVTDHLADLLFCHNERAAGRLREERVGGRIVVCGDTMRETLAHFLPVALERSAFPACLGLEPGAYAVLTVHRPVNADDPAAMTEILRGVEQLGLTVVFPVHPRTLRNCSSARPAAGSRLSMIMPLGYLDMLALVRGARLVVTDSGGLQKEAMFIGTPCVTLRSETEWVETVECGMNTLAGDRPDAVAIERAAAAILARPAADNLDTLVEHHFGPPDVARRIVNALEQYLTISK